MRLFWWLPFGHVPEISVTQLDRLRKAGSPAPQLIDVRTTAEWRSGRIAGAVHVPITGLGSRIAGLQLDAARPIVAICRSAHRSIPAVRLLRRHGFKNACQLQGGMLAWWQAGLPLEVDCAALKPGDKEINMSKEVKGEPVVAERHLGAAKRTFTSANLLGTVANCAISFPIIIRSIFRPKTSKALREKVMLGVTAINDCRYCAWGHSHWAISQGVPLETINQILSNQDDSLKAHDPAEAAAILFGQHYAEHLGEIDPDAVKSLRNYFSQSEIREIVGYVYFITFTNLSGNTVDVVLDRLRRKGRPITVVEAVAGFVLAPILLLLVLLVKLGKLVGTDKRRAKRHRIPQHAQRDGASTRAL